MGKFFERIELYVSNVIEEGGFPKPTQKYFRPKLEAVLAHAHILKKSESLTFQFTSPFDKSTLEAIAVGIGNTKSTVTRLNNALLTTYLHDTGHFKTFNAPIKSPMDIAVQLGRWHPLEAEEPSDMSYYILMNRCPEVGNASIAVLTSYLCLVGMPINKEFAQAAYLLSRQNTQR